MYIDPNTGGLLFQVLAGIFGLISGAVLLFSGQIKMIFARLRRSMRKEEKGGESDPVDDAPSHAG